MKKIMGGFSIILALVIGILPIFTDCQSQGRSLELVNGKTVPMKCHWTGIAEIGVAIPLGLVGVSEILSKRKETFNFLSLMGVALGSLAILFPTVLIGVCANPDMVCNMIMKPGLVLSGSLAIVASVVVFITSRKVAEANL
ncbi:MAG: hypothetical protein A2030_08890 [Chloroflexi bacterium RBG_19FT_COMBO_50_10]|nr:MAG: hypothetical protein A2030_08890 [Chloroflexi bacterium RBG_19FT_COMBO_50_10]